MKAEAAVRKDDRKTEEVVKCSGTFRVTAA
jgi:hypothetical protein